MPIWPCLRLVKENWDTMSEMESGTRLSIDDVDLANLALDAYEDALVRMRKRKS